jgi:hypothetical protein
MLISLLAHLRAFGRHRTTILVGGYHFTYCVHRSHALGLACWRWMIWDGQCSVHANSCFHGCPEDAHDSIYDTDTETEF